MSPVVPFLAVGPLRQTMPEFFFSVYRTKEGKISSAYPAWYFDRQIENMEESIDQKKRALKGGFVPRESEGEYHVPVSFGAFILIGIGELRNAAFDFIKSFKWINSW